MTKDEEIADLKHRNQLLHKHNRKMLGCLKLIATLPLNQIGCYYELRIARRLSIKGAWGTLYGNDGFMQHADTTFGAIIPVSEPHRQLARSRRNGTKTERRGSARAAGVAFPSQPSDEQKRPNSLLKNPKI